MPAAEFTCACGHLLADHEPPGGNARPWGACRVNKQAFPTMKRCDCVEAWPLEEEDPR